MIIRSLLLFVCISSCFISCGTESKPLNEESAAEVRPDSLVKFITLDFEMDGRPSKAAINLKYKNHMDKAAYPLSLFITINTLGKDSLGFPTKQESEVFQKIEDEILSKLVPAKDYCYVGRTTMTGYRDIIFYLNPKDRSKSEEILKLIQKTNPRIQSITFEDDPAWEGVAEFYNAIKI